MSRKERNTREGFGNALLDALDAAIGTALATRLELVDIPLRTTLYDIGEPVDWVYFPVDALISIVTTLRDGSAIEVGAVGREGMTGAPSIHDGSTVMARWICQIAGAAYRMPRDAFRSACEEFPALNAVTGAFLGAQFDVLAQSIACNSMHYVNERCARWLLMTHDRVGRDEFLLTHEFLATMLGVRRAGVSIAAATLQNAGYISYVRGRFTIRDRAGLESAACECYALTRAAYSRRPPLTGSRVPPSQR